MNPLPESPSRETPYKTLRMIWFAFMAAVCGYMLVSYFLLNGKTQAESAPGGPDVFILWILVALGLLQCAVAFFLPGLLLQIAGELYGTHLIVRWALIESMAIYGLVLLLLGGDWRVGGGMMLGTLLLLGALPPEERKR